MFLLATWMSVVDVHNRTPRNCKYDQRRYVTMGTD